MYLYISTWIKYIVHVNEVEGLETITLSELATAKYNYNSRRFPHWFGLARTGTEDKGRRIYDQTQGCMCPVSTTALATPPTISFSAVDLTLSLILLSFKDPRPSQPRDAAEWRKIPRIRHLR